MMGKSAKCEGGYMCAGTVPEPLLGMDGMASRDILLRIGRDLGLLGVCEWGERTIHFKDIYIVQENFQHENSWV